MADMMPQNALQGPQNAPQASQMPQQGQPIGSLLGGSQNATGASQQAPQPAPEQQAATGNEQLARYRQRRAAIYGEAQQQSVSRDPFAVTSGGPIEQEAKQQTQKDVWLASTAVAAKPLPTFQKHEHDNFMEHYNNDPAVKELNDMGVWDIVNTMAAMVKNGDMSFQDAIAQLQSDGFTSTVNSVIEKHHKDNPHSMIDHPMKTKRGNPERYSKQVPTADTGLTSVVPQGGM